MDARDPLRLSRRVFVKTLTLVGASGLITGIWTRTSSVVLGAVRLLGLQTPAAPSLKDVAGAAGILYTGKSWGAAWGDFNADGHLDVWTDNHTGPKSLW